MTEPQADAIEQALEAQGKQFDTLQKTIGSHDARLRHVENTSSANSVKLDAIHDRVIASDDQHEAIHRRLTAHAIATAGIAGQMTWINRLIAALVAIGMASLGHQIFGIFGG